MEGGRWAMGDGAMGRSPARTMRSIRPRAAGQDRARAAHEQEATRYARRGSGSGARQGATSRCRVPRVARGRSAREDAGRRPGARVCTRRRARGGRGAPATVDGHAGQGTGRARRIGGAGRKVGESKGVRGAARAREARAPPVSRRSLAGGCAGRIGASAAARARVDPRRTRTSRACGDDSVARSVGCLATGGIRAQTAGGRRLRSRDGLCDCGPPRCARARRGARAGPVGAGSARVWLDRDGGRRSLAFWYGTIDVSCAQGPRAR